MMIRVCRACSQKNRIDASHLARRVNCGRCKTAIAPVAEPIEADAELFDQIAQHATVPVLVDFWAAWCGPCRMAAPEVEKVAASMAGRALVVKVDTDQHPEVASRYNVRGIPNFVVLRDGQSVRQQAGVVPQAEMERWLAQASAASV